MTDKTADRTADRTVDKTVGRPIGRPVLPGAAAPPAAAPPATWFLDANTLTCIDQQETNLTRGDEVYVASLKFRTTPGVAGTTSVVFTGGLVDIPRVNTGDTLPIPDSMGRVPFAGVTRLGAAEVLAGQAPEVIGTATVVFESDLTTKTKIGGLLVAAADEVEPILAAASEQVSFADLLDDDAIGQVLGQLVADVDEALKLKVGQKVSLFLTGLTDPDDKIAQKINIFVAVDDVLAPVVDGALADALGPEAGVGGGVRTRTYSQRFSGRKAIYDITFRLTE